MRHERLLPGVVPAATPPAVVVESRKIIARARMKAALRDALQLLIVAGVDLLFIRWPLAHIPGFNRQQSALMLAAANSLVIGWMILVRALPRITARRIANTWNESEKQRQVRPAPPDRR